MAGGVNRVGGPPTPPSELVHAVAEREEGVAAAQGGAEELPQAERTVDVQHRAAGGCLIADCVAGGRSIADDRLLIGLPQSSSAITPHFPQHFLPHGMDPPLIQCSITAYVTACRGFASSTKGHLTRVVQLDPTTPPPSPLGKEGENGDRLASRHAQPRPFFSEALMLMLHSSPGSP
eukprot:EG_transcript_16071